MIIKVTCVNVLDRIDDIIVQASTFSSLTSVLISSHLLLDNPLTTNVLLHEALMFSTKLDDLRGPVCNHMDRNILTNVVPVPGWILDLELMKHPHQMEQFTVHGC